MGSPRRQICSCVYLWPRSLVPRGFSPSAFTRALLRVPISALTVIGTSTIRRSVSKPVDDHSVCCSKVLTHDAVAADKALGNPEGWATEFAFKSQQRGVATFVFAAFDPSLKCKHVTASPLLASPIFETDDFDSSQWSLLYRFTHR